LKIKLINVALISYGMVQNDESHEKWHSRIYINSKHSVSLLDLHFLGYQTGIINIIKEKKKKKKRRGNENSYVFVVESLGFVEGGGSHLARHG
jgi:hypothetical protein